MTIKDPKRGRPFDKLKPGPLATPPLPPPTLSAVGAATWKTCAGYLVDRGLLATGDLPALETFCAGVARHQRLDHEMQEAPLMIGDKPNPLLAAIGRETTAIRAMALSLQLVPYARSGLDKATRTQASATTKGSNWDGIINMPDKKKRG